MSRAHEYAAARLGRKLTAAELNIDIDGGVQTLEAGKDRLQKAINRELRRAARSHREGSDLTLHVTDGMTGAMDWLVEQGRKAARDELRAIGLDPATLYVKHDPLLTALVGKLRDKLAHLTTKARARAVEVTIGAETTSAPAADVQAAVSGTLGARSIAADLVSGSFYLGMGEVFGTAADRIASWLYTAVMDGGTCDVCSGLDGTEYESWDAIQEVLPNGGPNPDCDGGDRCRCRAAPTGLAE